MRGENPKLLTAERLCHGSPPRARGERRLHLAGRVLRRITPACAGRTQGDEVAGFILEDHPRVRGENECCPLEFCYASGSPPRARGEPIASVVGSLTPRITPACAGRTRRCPRIGYVNSDHPRVRGENRRDRTPSNRGEGSPPRARGERMRGRLVRQRPGITPACAGRTTTSPPRSSATRDHPRVRGENCVVGRPPGGHCGSPPRARGEQGHLGVFDDAGGITPACAGRTSAGRASCRGSRDHPRVRGENSILGRSSLPRPGSPPRARGEQDRRRRPGRGHRITPACAGRTVLGGVSPQVRKDHPRVRGENFSVAVACKEEMGSPPRARGEPYHRLIRQWHARITPACAGRTPFHWQ